MIRQEVASADTIFDGINEQMQAYEILSAEDRRTRYLFFAGDVGDVPEPGGMRVQSKCVPKKTLYRCMVTPVVTVRNLELTNLIPQGGVIPGSENRVKAGCSEYWIFAGPEVQTLLRDYGSTTDTTRSWGLVELAPELLAGLDWEKDVKPLRIQQTIFPDWPNSLPASNFEVLSHLRERVEFLKTTDDAFIARNRDLYLTVAEDMTRAVEAAQRHQEYTCARSNQGVAEPRGSEAYKFAFDGRDDAAFRRSGMIRNTQALQRVAEEMKNSTKGNGIDAAALKEILSTVVPAQQPAFSPEALATIVAAAIKMVNEQAETKKPNANAQRKLNGDPASA